MSKIHARTATSVLLHIEWLNGKDLDILARQPIDLMLTISRPSLLTRSGNLPFYLGSDGSPTYIETSFTARDFRDPANPVLLCCDPDVFTAHPSADLLGRNIVLMDHDTVIAEGMLIGVTVPHGHYQIKQHDGTLYWGHSSLIPEERL